MITAKILEVSASELLGERSKMVNNQNHNQTANAYNFDKINKIINADKNQIQSLKDEIKFFEKRA